MAAPAWKNGNAHLGATDAGGAWTYTCAAPSAAGHVVIVQFVQDGTTNGAVSAVVGTNIENLAGTDNVWTQIPGPNGDGSWPIGNPVTARQFLYIGRALSTTAPTISGANSTSEDLYIRSQEFFGVNTGTTLADVIENGTAGVAVNGTGTGTTISDTGITTLGPDRMFLQFIAADDDITIGVLDGETGGNWQTFVNNVTYAEASGTDAALRVLGAYGYDYDFLVSTITSQSFGSSGVQRAATSFLAPSTGSSWRVAVAMRSQNSPADHVVLEIHADSSGAPSGTPLGSTTDLDPPAQPTGSFYAVVSATITASLTSGTRYWLVARRTGSFGTLDYTWGSSFADQGETGLEYDGANWVDPAAELAMGITAGTGESGATVNGGTTTVVSAGWGVVGFALIGTTVAAVTAALPLGATRGAGRDRYGLMSRARALMPWWIEPRIEQALPAMMAPLGE